MKNKNGKQPWNHFDTPGSLSTPVSDVHWTTETNGTAIKITRETTNNQ